MTDYLDLPLVTDSDALLQTGVAYLEGAIPGFVARPGNVETVLLEATSQVAAEVVAQAAQVDPVVFAYLGGALVGLPIRSATSATGTATVTWAPDTPAVMLPSGSQLAVPHPSGEAMLFETDSDLVAPAGGGQQAVGITATVEGAEGNGCYGEAELVTVVDGVGAVVVPTATAGGADTEDTDDYLDRLADAFTILAPRPILPGDHATLVRQLPEVGRAMAIDLLLPGTADAPGAIRDPLESQPPPAASQTNTARCTTVAITQADGSAPSVGLMQEAWDLLDASREVNFLNYVISPTYTAVGVQAVLHPWPGYSDADVINEAEGQLATWLSALLWDSSGAADASTWAVQNQVRISEAVEHLNRCTSVHWVELATVKLKLGTGAWQAADLTLPGLVPLPTPGAFELTVGTL
jgi:hypothetical protein